MTGDERLGSVRLSGEGLSMRTVVSAGRLLASGSAVAITGASGNAALACNPSVVINGSGTMGGITNSGNIECVVVGDGTVVDGNITNDGTVGAAASPAETGILVHNA